MKKVSIFCIWVPHFSSPFFCCIWGCCWKASVLCGSATSPFWGPLLGLPLLLSVFHEGMIFFTPIFPNSELFADGFITISRLMCSSSCLRPLLMSFLLVCVLTYSQVLQTRLNVCFYSVLHICWWSVQGLIINSSWLQFTLISPVEAERGWVV